MRWERRLRGKGVLLNRTRGIKVAERHRVARGLLQQFRGLMFRSPSSVDYALVFPLPFPSRLGASVHMLFVFFPIDLVFLDAGKRVVDVKLGFPPFALNYTPKKPAAYFIELRAGLAEKIGIGDELEWK